jgi:hypothetical protein
MLVYRGVRVELVWCFRVWCLSRLDQNAGCSTSTSQHESADAAVWSLRGEQRQVDGAHIIIIIVGEAFPAGKPWRAMAPARLL